MTNGTSQALYIIIAVVIFGIFIGLSYTVLGSEGLTGDLVDIFEQPVKHIEDSAKLKALTTNDWVFNDDGEPLNTHTEYENGFLISSIGTEAVGLMLHDSYITHGRDYELSFDLTTVNGLISRIGGHIHTLEDTAVRVYIDNKLVGTDFYTEGVAFNFKKGEKHTVKIVFVATTNEILDSSNQIDKRIYIQPNRYYGDNESIMNYGKPYVAKIENIDIKEI